MDQFQTLTDFLSEKFDAIDKRFDKLEIRMTNLETRVTSIEVKIDDLPTQAYIDGKINQVWGLANSQKLRVNNLVGKL